MRPPPPQMTMPRPPGRPPLPRGPPRGLPPRPMLRPPPPMGMAMRPPIQSPIVPQNGGITMRPPPPRNFGPRSGMPPRPMIPPPRPGAMQMQMQFPPARPSIQPRQRPPNPMPLPQSSPPQKQMQRSLMQSAGNESEFGLFIVKRTNLSGQSSETQVKTMRIEFDIEGDKGVTNSVAIKGDKAVFTEALNVFYASPNARMEISAVDVDTDRVVASCKVFINEWISQKGFSGQLTLKSPDASKNYLISLQVAHETENAKNAKLFQDFRDRLKKRQFSGKNAHLFGNDYYSDEQIKEAFTSFDLDGNNYVGAAELKHILTNIGEKVLDEDIDAMINLCDVDGDGQVSFPEFYSMVTDGKEPPGENDQDQNQRSGSMRNLTDVVRPRKTAAKPGAIASKTEKLKRKQILQSFVDNISLTPQAVKKAYKRYRTLERGAGKSGGHLTSEELKEILRCDRNAEFEEMFNQFDYQNKGRLDFQELSITLFNASGAEKQERLKFAFLVFDEDGNNVISKEELSQILKANHMAGSESEVQRKVDTIMAQSDKNGDGVLSFDEFVSVSQKFPNILWPRS